MSDQETMYTKKLQDVINKEKAYYKQRRKKAADEFVAAKEQGAAKTDLDGHPMLQQLRDPERSPVGLAFSGGGIRSATFNLGLLQGLSKFGILPWVDYLTSVSGGGFIASCLTSLLSYEEKKVILPDASKEIDAATKSEEEQQEFAEIFANLKRLVEQKPPEQALAPEKQDRYYPLNTQWERFPFNPALQVFNDSGIAYDQKHELKEGTEIDFEKKVLPLKPSDDQNRNKQLEHLRNMGDYLIPRTGIATPDTMRALGAFLLRVVYTLLIFLAAMSAITAMHYAIAAAFTPEILTALELGATPSINTLLFSAYHTNSIVIPWNIYGTVLLNGMEVALLLALIFSFAYRKNVTTENRYRPWRSPSDNISTYTWIRIRAITAIGALLITGLAWCTARFWSAEYANLANTQSYFYFTLAGLFAVYFLASLYFLLFHARDERWSKRGLSEREWMDNLVTILVFLLTLWSMTLILAALKITEGFDTNTMHIYWIWMPAIFLFGGGWGLILFQYLPDIPILKIITKPLVTKQVSFPKDRPYDRKSVNLFVRLYLRWVFRLRGMGDPFDETQVRVSRGVSKYTFSIWSNPDFRSIYWTMQGLFMYGTLVFILLGAVLIPHYFLILQEGQTQAYISLSVAVISGALARFLAKPKSDGGESWLTKLMALPSEIRLTLLALLVFVFNLSILYLLETLLDTWVVVGSDPWKILIVAGASLVLLFLLGQVNANYLSAHYFFRDRAADAYLRTEVDDHDTGRVHMPRDDRDRPMSHIAQDDCSAPYHIIQTTLNLAGSWFLNFKDRKSQSFILSKEYCGSEMTGYVRTRDYRGNSTKYSQAVALSGAAVSSGLGFLTFFAQSFVTTLFNLRLGLWMDNPAEYEPQKAPKNLERSVSWLPFLWDEMSGRISERRKLVNLTDGAHTDDNIGLYPLFQRRCQYIFAGDAGEDPEGKCESLMAVLRQVEIDFGIKVDIDVEGLKPGSFDREKKTSTESQSHFAIGKISYPSVGNVHKMAGWLIYFRPSVVKGDPAPLLKYWQGHPLDYPHPSTADQFFDEEQFEIQRRLGEWTVVSALKTIREEIKRHQKGRAKARLTTYVDFIDTLIKHDGEDVPIEFTVPELEEPQEGEKRKPVHLEDILRKYHDSVSRPDQPA